MCSVSFWEIWSQCGSEVSCYCDWQVKQWRTQPGLVCMRCITFLFSAFTNMSQWNTSKYDKFSCLCLYVNVLSFNQFGSRISTENLHLVRYEEKDICLSRALLWCALPLLSATINEIHLRSQARQINPIRFCHSLCVLQWRSRLLFPSSLTLACSPLPFILSLILFLLLPQRSTAIVYLFGWKNGTWFNKQMHHSTTPPPRGVF